MPSRSIKIMTLPCYILITCLFWIALFSVNTEAEQADAFAYTEWLVGTWQHNTKQENGSIYEQWTKVSDAELTAESYIVNNGEKTVFETIRLLQNDNGIFYIPTVHNQNEGMPVSFALKAISETKMIFVNPQHDFPKQISYEQLTDNSLAVELSGTSDSIIKISMHKVE